MKKRHVLLYTLILLLLTASGCSSEKPGNKVEEQQQEDSNEVVELTVSAAASLQNALNDIKEKFEKAHANVKIVYNFGGSGTLQQQISLGAPVDLFFSAAEDTFDQLVEEGLVEEDNGIDLLGNELVLVVPKGSDKGIDSFKDLDRAKTISIGTPETVPAGQYAKETLENLDLWNSVEKRLVFAKDVRQVLTYVETGNVDAGIVYKTDALTSTKVKIAAAAEESTHSPIIYPLGVINNSAHLEEAKTFYEYLQNKSSLKTFEKYGFTRFQ